MKLKIKASERIKNRYLLLQATHKEEIEKVILDYTGILGWARANPTIINFKGKLVLSVNRKELDNVKAAFEVYNKKIRILKISGTLKGLN